MAGLTLAKCREYETTDARLASEIARNLSYAGLALIWIYRNNRNQIPIELIPACVCFILFFLFDLTQYVYKAEFWARFYQEKEDELRIVDPDGNVRYQEEREFSVPTSFHRTVDNLYRCKIGMVLLAFIWLLGYLAFQYSKISTTTDVLG